MKNRIAVGVMTVLLLCCASMLQAQKSSGRGGASLVQILDSKSGNGESGEIAKDIPGMITVSTKAVPRYELSKGKDAPELKYARPWLEIAVPFKTNTKIGTPWLDNLQVKVELMSPVVGPKGRREWAVLSGDFALEPVANVSGLAVPPGFILAEKGDYVYHVVRFYLSPATISRYFVGMSEPPKNFEKILAGIPVRVTIDGVGGAPVQGIKPAGKEFVSFVKEKVGGRLKADDTASTQARFKDYDANNRGYFELFDTVLSSADSPWEWVDYERQEHTKKQAAARR